MSPNNNSSWVLLEHDSYESPSAAFSLTAEPLPTPPSPSELPPELVKTVQENSHLFPIICPIKVERMEAYTAGHPNRTFVKSVLYSIRHGFYPKVVKDLRELPATFDGSREVRRDSKAERLMIKQRDEEIKKSRYSPSFGTTLLPGMHALPQCVVRSKGKDRLVTDNSSGEYAPNTLLSREQCSVSGDKIEDFIRKLCQAKLSEGDRMITLFKSDVSSAYRILPMHPYWQARQVVKIQGQYHVDRCNSFGCRASGYFFCAFYSLVLWIAEHKRGLHDIFTYVDDNFSFESEDNTYNYQPYGVHLPKKQAMLLKLWDDLGIPHEQRKQLQGPQLDLIGRSINVRTMRMHLPEQTIEKLLSAINAFIPPRRTGRTTTIDYKPLHDFHNLNGMIDWASNFLRPLRLGSVAIKAVLYEYRLSIKDSEGNPRKNLPLPINNDIVKELAWLVAHIKIWKGSPLYSIIPKSTLEIHCTATSSGCGFHCESQSRGYHEDFKVPHNDTVYSHAISIIRAIEWSSTVDPRKDSILIYCRDKTMLAMLQNYRPMKAEYNGLLRRIVDCVTKHDIAFRVSGESKDETGFTVANLLASGRAGDAREIMGRHYKIVQRNFEEVTKKSHHAK